MKLTNREEQIMDFLWEAGPSFVKEVVSTFEDPKPHYNTVSTIVRNLEQKGFIGHEDFGTTYRYFAAISKEDYVTRNLKKDVKKYFNNSFKSLVSSLVESRDISIEEVKELIELAKNKSK
jgi:BlaI family transcriptional regulator, penicillinase repressor